MSESSNGSRLTMLSGSGASGMELQSADRPQPVVSGHESDKEASRSLLLQAEHLAETVKDKANVAVVGVGQTISGMAESLREHSPASFAPYTGKAVAGLEQAGSYLQRGTIGGIFDDLTGIMGRHPVPVMLTGVALGFLLARKLRR